MRVDQQPAYVLHARPYRETSLLLECLTRDHGRIGAVARGVRGGKGRLQRSHLEPFQPLLLDLQFRGELATLRDAEARGVVRLQGERGLAGLYLNELVVRLTARQDPQPEIFDAYERTLARLRGSDVIAWTLRRFERDFLQALGYGLVLDGEADGVTPLDPGASYRYSVEAGAVRCTADQRGAVRGEDLIALSRDQMPGAAGLQALRGLMRELIRFHLGGGELRAWQVLGAAMSRR